MLRKSLVTVYAGRRSLHFQSLLGTQEALGEALMSKRVNDLFGHRLGQREGGSRVPKPVPNVSYL